VVPKVDESLREVARVYALAADVRFAAIREVGETKWTFSKSVELALHVGSRHAI
jgi:hypothetical protein